MKTGAGGTTTIGSHGEDAGGSCAGEGRHQDEGGDTSLPGIGFGAGGATRRFGPDGLHAIVANAIEQAVGVEDRLHAPGAAGGSTVQVQDDNPGSTESLDGGGVEESI